MQFVASTTSIFCPPDTAMRVTGTKAMWLLGMFHTDELLADFVKFPATDESLRHK